MQSKLDNKVRSLACGILMLASSGVLASSMYAGGSFSSVDLEAFGEGPTMDVLSGRIGKQWNEHMSGELRMGFGLGHDSING